MTRGFLDDDSAAKSELCDLEAEVVTQTKLAWLIDDGRVRVWIPKAQAERDGKTFTMPLRLALEKGLC